MYTKRSTGKSKREKEEDKDERITEIDKGIAMILKIFNHENSTEITRNKKA